MSSEDTKNVILVGGGPASLAVVGSIVKSAAASKTSATKIMITVIDKQDYFDWSLASPRMLVDPDSIDKYGYCMPLDKVLEYIVGKDNDKVSFKLVQGLVSKVSDKQVTLDDGTKLDGDVIVIAIGGQYKSSNGIWKPSAKETTKELRIASLKALKEKVEKSKHVVVAGCGPTGVEVAGEIKSAFPSIKVTMVGNLLPNSPQPLIDRMKLTLTKELDITLVEGQRVDIDTPDKDGNVTTRDKKSTIEGVDLILNAAGFIFKGKALADSTTISKDVTERGQFNCKHTLQLQNYENVFCCGDILKVPDGYYADVKGLQHADVTGECVGANIVKYLNGEEVTDFNWSKTPINYPMMTALGTNLGVGYLGLPNYTIFNYFENFLVRQLKCSDYYMSLKGKSVYGKGVTW